MVKEKKAFTKKSKKQVSRNDRTTTKVFDRVVREVSETEDSSALLKW